MHKVISGLIKEKPEAVTIDYFGLNHLGWIKQVITRNIDHLPELIRYCKNKGNLPGLPFSPDLVESLGLIPNEYLYYYYYSSQSVNNILKAKECRGEQLTRLNNRLVQELRKQYKNGNLDGMRHAYEKYLNLRGETYMRTETGIQQDLSSLDSALINSIADEGYAGVALDLIEALTSGKSMVQILNVANRGAITDLADDDVVEIPNLVNYDHIQPLAISGIPSHCLGLIRQVKEYEHLTIDAAVNGSYNNALLALTIHPLVRDYALAKMILDGYISGHKQFFPPLN
jgi:6-phospho-beta-glucosidase